MRLILFDVQNLFPSIPVDPIYRLMEERWNDIEKFTYLTREQFIAAVESQQLLLQT